MRRKTSGLVRGLVLVLALVGLMALLPAPAGARGLIVCDASGVVEFTANPPGPSASPWTIAGIGSCQGDFGGTYHVSFTGAGSSDTLGRCGGTDFVQNLNLNVAVTLTSFADLSSKLLTERWFAPLTTFPVASPFLIQDGGLVGEGVFLTRIFGECPPEGIPVAKFIWSRIV